MLKVLDLLFFFVSAIKVQVFFEKHIENKHLCCPDKNYYYSCKLKIPGISLIVGSRNMRKVSKYMSFLKKINGKSRFHQIPVRFLAFFIVFEWGRIFDSAVDK